MTDKIQYSEKYADDEYEYRMVTLPRLQMQKYRKANPNDSFNEAEWRSLGVKQSRGWENYGYHQAEPHILLFRRLLFTDP